MITVQLARALRDAGLRWRPERGDRFIVDEREMDEQVFVVSDMTIDVHEFPHGKVLGFNGTVEWALDSVDQDQALWLPSEHQLREALGESFVALLREADGWRVGMADGTAYDAVTADDAYAQALLSRLSVRAG